MPVGPGVIFPRIAPVSPGADDDDGGVHDGVAANCGFNERLPEISRTKLAQSELRRAEVIEARREHNLARPALGAQVRARNIKLNLVERASASGCAKESLALRMLFTAHDSRREKKQL